MVTDRPLIKTGQGDFERTDHDSHWLQGLILLAMVALVVIGILARMVGGPPHSSRGRVTRPAPHEPCHCSGLSVTPPVRCRGFLRERAA